MSLSPNVRPAPPDTAKWLRPWVQLKYFSFHPCIYPAMVRGASPDAVPGSVVNVYDKDGRLFGSGMFNPHARVPLRVLRHSIEPLAGDLFQPLIDDALRLRIDQLKLPEVTDAFRVIHSDGDGLSGLIIDKLGETLSIEVHSLGIFQRLTQWLPLFHQRLGTKKMVLSVDDFIAKIERINPKLIQSDPVRLMRVMENGIRYEIDFETSHKTGFFCDQRENRRRLTRWTGGKRVLDLCCYTGGFSLSAMMTGNAADVTGVDLDEKAIAQAKRNANLNQARVNWVHCDAYSFARQMQRNGEQWDVVITDPPKLVFSKDDFEEGIRKYEDMNSLAASLVKPGGVLVTCSCSGQVP